MYNARAVFNGFKNKTDSIDNKKCPFYNITITVPSPYHNWIINKRFSDFEKLHQFLGQYRKINCEFPTPGLLEHARSFLFSKITAFDRIPLFEKYLNYCLQLPDLTMIEVEYLKKFLEYNSNVNPLERSSFDSDFGSYRGSDLRGVTRDLFASKIENASNAGSLRASEVLDRCTIDTLDYRNTIDMSNEAKAGDDYVNKVYPTTPGGLREAIRNNDTEGVYYIIKMKSHLVNTPDEFGNVSLYYAALFGSISMGRLLIQQNADLTIANLEGITAMDIALDTWRDQISLEAEKVEMDKNKGKDIVLDIVIHKDSTGSIGLNLGSSVDKMVIVVSFKGVSMDAPQSPSSQRILLSDKIIGVNDVKCSSLSEAVALIKAAPEQLTLRVQRKYEWKGAK